MIDREAEPTLQRLAKGFPVVCISGPRQSGKTTLARKAFPDKPYISLEDPDIALLAREDPRGLLDNYRDGLILDEAQSVPTIFSYLKTAVDREPFPGKFIITGSQQFGLVAGITESLAGRASFLTLLPFTTSELSAASLLSTDPFKALSTGFYPPLFSREVSPYDFHTAYIMSYLERDVRSILNVKDLSTFQTFIRMCASRTGQLVNLSSLALDAGITHNTAKSWLSILESSGIIFLLRPWHTNFGKRLVKSPKLYFVDTGLACRLLGISSEEQLFLHPNRGNIFESFAVSEMLKKRLNAGKSPDLYFWRDNTGMEIDIISDNDGSLKAFEVKSGKTFSSDYTSNLEAWMRFSGTSPKDCAVIYAGNLEPKINDISLISWNHIP